jgi:hypothetical protein
MVNASTTSTPTLLLHHHRIPQSWMYSFTPMKTPVIPSSSQC